MTTLLSEWKGWYGALVSISAEASGWGVLDPLSRPGRHFQNPSSVATSLLLESSSAEEVFAGRPVASSTAFGSLTATAFRASKTETVSNWRCSRGLVIRT